MQKSVFKILITLYIPGNFSYFLFIKLTIEIGIKINFFQTNLLTKQHFYNCFWLFQLESGNLLCYFCKFDNI